MNLLNEFKTYLFNQKTKPSKATVKNYAADISQFIVWFETEFRKTFSPESVTIQILDLYKKSKSQNLSAASVKRHISSLHKFFSFLKLEGIISENPFELDARRSSELDANKDLWHLKDFKNYLYVCNASGITIKNYLNDINQFTAWLDKITGNSHEINESLVNEYKNRLISLRTESGASFSPKTINRKLSSLRKYLTWAKENGLIEARGGEVEGLLTARTRSARRETSGALAGRKPRQDPKRTRTADRDYSHFPPFRLAQKTKNGILFLSDSIIILPIAKIIESGQYLIWKLKGKPVFKNQESRIRNQRSIRNFPKELYAPLDISTKHFPIYKKLFYIIRHNRPEWYKKYHLMPASHYLHLAILIVIMSAVGFGVYQSITEKPKNQAGVLASTTLQAPPRIMSFQGKLTNSSDVPITTATLIRFGIYDTETATGSALKWQEVDTVTPDSDGLFSLYLGKNNNLSQDLFAEHAGLWLGVTIGQTPELTPRQQLATVAYAENAATLQGLSPITQTDAGTSNVVLALDSSGNLSIGGTATPTFQATGGKFTLSGTVLTLTTTAGSNSNVQIAPDGRSFIDLQKPLQNTTNNNNISTALGAVEVDDLFAILATSSAQSALTINQNDTGPLISASSSAIAKFTVDNSGNTTIAGNFLPTLTANKDLGSSSIRWNNLWVQTINTTAVNTSGQTSFTYDPSDTTITESNVLLNPTSAGPNEALLGLAIGGSERARIDTEGDLALGFASGTLTPNANPLTVYNHGTTQVASIDTSGALTLSGAITAPTSTNTINSLVINAGALSGITSINMSGQLTSTLAIGTAPFVVTSTTNVANLNASSLNGATFAAPGAIGGGTPSTGAYTTLTSSGNTTLGTGASGTHTFGSGAGSTVDIGNSTGALTLASGGTSAWTNTAGDLTIQTATSGTLALDSAGALNIGGTNATSIGIGRTGVTTTNNGALTSTQTLTASNGLTLTTGALNLTGTSGSIALSGFGTTSITSTTASGNILTLADASFTTTGANLANFTYTNTNSGAGAVVTNGVSITPTGTAITGGGSNTLNAINLSDVTPIASNTFNALNFGTGYTNFINSGTVVLTAAGALSGITTLSASGAIAANGGITFDNSTDTLGAHTLGGTLDASTQIIENIGNTGTDFVATTGALTLAGVLTANGGVTVAGGQNLTLSSGTGMYSQTFTGTTTNAFAITANSLTSGNALNLSTNSTAALTGDALANLSVSGANGSDGITRYGLSSSVTSTGGTSTNVGLYSTASGATNNYAAIFDQGSVGINSTAPTAQLQVNTGSSSTVGQIIKGSTSQSVDLLQLKTSLDAVIAKVDQLGNITGNTLISTVTTGTAPLTVASTTVVSNLNSSQLQGYSAENLYSQPQPNLVLNSDFSRRNKWMTFMPEIFSDTAGWTAQTGSLGSVASNILTAGTSGGSTWRILAGLSTWKDVRMSAQWKAVDNPAGGALQGAVGRWQDSSNFISVFLSANILYLKRVTAGSSEYVATTPYTATTNNWYWTELEMQGSMAIAKLYSSGASAVAKSSATLVATMSFDLGAGGGGTSGQMFLEAGTTAASQWGGLSTGDGGVYVEGWGPESFTPSWNGSNPGGQAFGFDETADAGPIGKQWAVRFYIPQRATLQGIVLNQLTPDGSISPSTSYMYSIYAKVENKVGTGTLFETIAYPATSAGAIPSGGEVLPYMTIDDAGETSWTRKTATATTASTARRARLQYVLGVTNNVGGTGYFLLPQLEQGSVMTPWRNAPSDDGPIVWLLARTGSTNIAFTSATFIELDPNVLSSNVFLPWDGKIDVDIAAGARSSAAGNNFVLQETMDGSQIQGNSYGNLFVTAPVALYNFNLAHHVAVTAAAGKHRIAQLAKVDAGTTTIDVANVGFFLTITATRGKFDLAEEYSVQDQSIEAGDVVKLATNKTLHLGGVTSTTVEKTNKGYDQSVLGIVSTAPGITLSSTVELNSYQNKPNLRPVALSGRVPVKVTNENGIIKRGDILTSSATKPGYGMKATKAGRSIGIAMDDFAPTDLRLGGVIEVQTGKVMTFVNLSFYDPDVYLTDSGSFVINKVYPKPTEVAFISPIADSEVTTTPNCGQEEDPSSFGLVISTCPKTDLLSQIESSQAANYAYAITDSLGNTVQRVGVFSKAAIGNLKAGAIDAKEIVADNINVNSKIISPLASVGTLNVDTITPNSSNKVVIRLEDKRLTSSEIASSSETPKFEVQNASGSAVASIDTAGNASFSGTLNSFGLSTENASISGTLRTKSLIADNIDTQILNLKSQISDLINPEASSSAELVDIASYSAQLAYVDTLQATTGTFTQGLFAIGPSSFSDASIFGQLSVGGNLTIADNSINVLGSDLNFQSLGQGGISFLAGKVYIDTDGNLNVDGNATVKGTLFANIISPIPGSDLIFNLSSSEIHNSQFIIHNSSGSAVLSINDEGDVTSSGSAKFSDLLAKTFSVVRNAQADTSLNETIASSSAGFAIIVKGQLERTIITPFVKENSLIYLSPASDIQGMTPYVSRQTVDDPNLGTKASFTIGISHIVNSDIRVNWWIVN